MKRIPIIFILVLLPLLASYVDPFAYGSGHLRPTEAADPGPKALPTAININNPTITIHKFSGTATVTRTLTNDGASKNVYLFSSTRFNGLYTMASPSQLSFDNVGEKKNFTITVQTDALAPPPTGQYASGEFTWTDGVHFVKTPLLVYFD